MAMNQRLVWVNQSQPQRTPPSTQVVLRIVGLVILGHLAACDRLSGVLPDRAPNADTTAAANSPDSGSATHSAGVSVAALADAENYLVCSQPLLNQMNSEDLGYCFAFSKRGDRLTGYYYDTKTFGGVGLCLTGTLSQNRLEGQGVEFIGNIGRQQIPPGSDGQELVNWDPGGYLKVAQAEVLRASETTGEEVRYNKAVLNFDHFYRHPDMENAVSARCQ
jgi:hypothetical protein